MDILNLQCLLLCFIGFVFNDVESLQLHEEFRYKRNHEQPAPPAVDADSNKNANGTKSNIKPLAESLPYRIKTPLKLEAVNGKTAKGLYPPTYEIKNQVSSTKAPIILLFDRTTRKPIITIKPLVKNNDVLTVNSKLPSYNIFESSTKAPENFNKTLNEKPVAETVSAFPINPNRNTKTTLETRGKEQHTSKLLNDGHQEADIKNKKSDAKEQTKQKEFSENERKITEITKTTVYEEMEKNVDVVTENTAKNSSFALHDSNLSKNVHVNDSLAQGHNEISVHDIPRMNKDEKSIINNELHGTKINNHGENLNYTEVNGPYIPQINNVENGPLKFTILTNKNDSSICTDQKNKDNYLNLTSHTPLFMTKIENKNDSLKPLDQELHEEVHNTTDPLKENLVPGTIPISHIKSITPNIEKDKPQKKESERLKFAVNVESNTETKSEASKPKLTATVVQNEDANNCTYTKVDIKLDQRETDNMNDTKGSIIIHRKNVEEVLDRYKYPNTENLIQDTNDNSAYLSLTENPYLNQAYYNSLSSDYNNPYLETHDFNSNVNFEPEQITEKELTTAIPENIENNISYDNDLYQKMIYNNLQQYYNSNLYNVPNIDPYNLNQNTDRNDAKDFSQFPTKANYNYQGQNIPKNLGQTTGTLPQTDPSWTQYYNNIQQYYNSNYNMPLIDPNNVHNAIHYPLNYGSFNYQKENLSNNGPGYTNKIPCQNIQSQYNNQVIPNNKPTQSLNHKMKLYERNNAFSNQAGYNVNQHYSFNPKSKLEHSIKMNTMNPYNTVLENIKSESSANKNKCIRTKLDQRDKKITISDTNPTKISHFTENYIPGKYFDRIWRSWNDMDIIIKNDGTPVKVEFGKDDKNVVQMYGTKTNVVDNVDKRTNINRLPQQLRRPLA